MKKLIALLVTCTMMTCTFASCGDDKSDETSEKSTSVSETEATEEKTTEEETTETETTKEETTEAETTETTTEPETEEVTESTSAEATEESITGMWYTEDDEAGMGFDFKKDGNIDMFVDLTDTSHFTSDGKFLMDSDILEPEFDGKTLSVKLESADVLTMTKESGSTDSFDGVYTLVSGMMYDSMIANVNTSDLYMMVDGERMYIGYRNLLSYTTDDNSISISGMKNIGMDTDSFQSNYEIENNILVLHDFEEDTDWKMTKFELSGSTDITENKTTSSENSVSDENRTTEGSVIGAWRSVDKNYGFRFNDDGTGNMLMDATEMMHFTDDGNFIFTSTTFEPENIQFDGTNLSVSIHNTDILTMTRTDGNDKNSFDGKYILKSGQVYEGTVSSVGKVFGIKPEDTTVYIIVDDEEIYIDYEKMFTYTTDNGNITFTGLSGMGIPDGSVILYEFEEDKFILTNGVDNEMIFEKIDI